MQAERGNNGQDISGKDSTQAGPCIIYDHRGSDPESGQADNSRRVPDSYENEQKKFTRLAYGKYEKYIGI